jgi:hypothetical protein
MVNVFILKAVDRGFIGGVMVSVLVSKVVDRGFRGSVMVSVLVSKAVDRVFIGGIMVIITPPMNPRSTAFETRTLTRHRWFIGGGLTFLSRKQ